MRPGTWWHEDAACAGLPVELFYPATAGAKAAVERVARAYCLPCPVREHCLASELARGRYHRLGIHGGVHWGQGGSVIDPYGLLPPGEGGER